MARVEATKSLALLGIAVALAACVDDAGPGTVDAEAGGTAPELPGVGAVSGTVDQAAALLLGLEGCRQFHEVFYGPAASFEPFLPEGFTLASPDPARSVGILLLYASFCPQRTLGAAGDADATIAPMNELTILLEVVPPAAHSDDSYTFDFLPIVWATDDEELLDAYAAVGLRELVEPGTFTLESLHEDAALRIEEVTVASGGVTWRFVSTVRNEGGTFEGGKARLWIQQASVATGFLVVQSEDAANIGLGDSFFTQEGDEGAPPATTGFSHTVDGVRSAIHYESIDASA